MALGGGFGSKRLPDFEIPSKNRSADDICYPRSIAVHPHTTEIASGDSGGTLYVYKFEIPDPGASTDNNSSHVDSKVRIPLMKKVRSSFSTDNNHNNVF